MLKGGKQNAFPRHPCSSVPPMTLLPPSSCTWVRSAGESEARPCFRFRANGKGRGEPRAPGLRQHGAPTVGMIYGQAMLSCSQAHGHGSSVLTPCPATTVWSRASIWGGGRLSPQLPGHAGNGDSFSGQFLGASQTVTPESSAPNLLLQRIQQFCGQKHLTPVHRSP